MDPERLARIEALYHTARSMPGDTRARFLRDACGADHSLRSDIESLLAQADPGGAPQTRTAASAGQTSPLIGQRLGTYQIIALIGAGGMGEVYRARDTRLHRDVALKILPDAFSQDPDRVARFAREAQLLASLSHPNIGAIHGIEDTPTGSALVLEMVEGPTLADRIAQRPLRLAEALEIARQIAEALDAAHGKGIVHRDLKPANVKLAPDGLVKVLDFGLAKAVATGDSTIDPTRSPTRATVATRAGVLLGTAAYMSPEQARAQTVDKRTDLWAFGCVLYEMLTGRAAFHRDTISDTIVAILDGQPDWQVLPPSVPASVRSLLRRCLQKDLKERLRDAGDAVHEIVDALAEPSVDRVAGRRVAAPVAILVSGALVGGLVVGAALRMAGPRVGPAVPRVVQFALTSGGPDALEPSGADRDLAISPDGTRVAYIAGGPGRARLVSRELGRLDSTLLSDRNTPRAPFFSPDGQWIGFFGLFGALKKVSSTGGPVIDVASTGGAGRGATWGPDDRIIFATTEPATGLWSIRAGGGEAEVLTRPDTGRGEVDHLWPEMLPGGRAVLFTILSAGSLDSAQIAVLDLTSTAVKVLIRGGTDAQYLPTGHLIYAAAGSLHAVPFDADRLEVTGAPVKMLEQVAITPEGGVSVAASQDGALAYVRVDPRAAARSLVWTSRDGRETPLALPPRPYIYPRLSPDGTRIALEVWDQERDIWIWNIARETLTRLTDNPGRDGFPVWTPDGKRVVFGLARGLSTNLFWRAADGTGTLDRLTESPRIQFPYSISPNGNRLIFREDDANTGLDIAITSLKDGRDAAPLIQTPFNELNAEISPDGRWLAYQSNESGQDEIYVRPFPDVGRSRWQVSTLGGTRPLWARSGRELFYLAPDGLNGVAVTPGPDFTTGRPIRLIEHRYFADTAFIGRTYDVAPDGERFLMIKPGGEADERLPRSVVVVVQGWFEELKRATSGK